MKEALSALAAVLFILGFIPYIRAIWRDRHLPHGTPGKAAPAKTSWIIWATLDSITFAGMLAAGTVNGLIIGAIIGAWTTVALAMKYGTAGWTLLDKLCLGGAALGIMLWIVFDSPTVGIVTSLAVVFLGSIPTFVSAWDDPARENRVAWTFFWVSCVSATFAIPHWTLADAAQPLVFLVIESIMMFILFVRPLWIRP